jgi:tRNA(Ile)-lysidine synthase
VRRALESEGECALPAGTPILVAVSGGPDSMALLSVLARLAPKLDRTIVAHGVDHGLRPAAKSELDLAAAHADAIGIPFARTRVAVGRGGNLQARAREARWEVLVGEARKHGAAIATAHHADDRAETLLMRLVRGAGARGLGVLPPRATAPSSAPPVLVVRPLLRARRADILLHLERHAVPSATDPSNTDPRYLRTSVRCDLLPLLAKLDPNIVFHLEALADELGNSDVRGKSQEWTRALPRSTQEALTRLVASGSHDARVWLPDGLVVSLDPRARRTTRPKRTTA